MMTRRPLKIAMTVCAMLALARFALPGEPYPISRARADALKIEMKSRVVRILDRPLVIAGGKPVRFLSDVIANQPVLLSFTFTGCLQLCPPSDIVMEGVAQKLEQAGRRDVRLVTLTLDPLADTPDRLFAERASKMHPDRLFLSGEPNHVWAVLDGLGIQAGPNQDHNIEFLLIGAGGKRVDGIPGLPDPDTLYAALTAAK